MLPADPHVQRALDLGLLTPPQAEEAVRLAHQDGLAPAEFLRRRLAPEAWARLATSVPANPAPPSFAPSSGPVPGAGFGLNPVPGVVQPAPPLGQPAGQADTVVGGLQSSAPGAGTTTLGPGSRIGDYEILRELARGGMGVVYVAWSAPLAREVAIKLLLEGSSTSQGLERFEIEARTAARLKHPNIVGIHHVGDHQGAPYLVMDLIPGRSLDELLAEEGPLDPREAVRIVHALAGALAYAHQRSVLHRDLKPHNVILRQDGTPILTDFGLAKDVEAEGVTVNGQMLGTPSYMPPEQAGGELETVDRRADVYGLGATLYHLLTGVPPFQGETFEILVGVLTRDPKPPASLRAEVDRDLNTLCLKCLEKEPEARYRTMGELEADLAAYLADQPLSARPPNLWDRARKWRRRNPHLSAVVLASGLLLGAGGSWPTSRSRAP
ncbi:MAG: protein kinase, partial [Planctomycetes bacterium]|nr:protein kinase [Planctomycetota bacterium]